MKGEGGRSSALEGIIGVEYRGATGPAAPLGLEFAPLGLGFAPLGKSGNT